MTTPVRCPSCDSPMTRENFASASIDVCSNGCHGLWFDAGELAKLDHAKKGMGPALQRALAQPCSDAGRTRERLDCPRCETPMDENGYELATWVTVDECPNCDGVFLDAGELARIRGRPLSAEEEARARQHRTARRRIRKRIADDARNRARHAELNIAFHHFLN